LEPSEVTLRFGATVADEGEKHHPETWFTYPKYDPNLNDGDVAFIIMAEPIRFTPTIQPIKIAERNERPKHGDMLTVAGWGRPAVGLNST